MLGILMVLMLAIGGHVMDTGVGPTGATVGTGVGHHFHATDTGIGPTG